MKKLLKRTKSIWKMVSSWKRRSWIEKKTKIKIKDRSPLVRKAERPQPCKSVTNGMRTTSPNISSSITMGNSKFQRTVLDRPTLRTLQFYLTRTNNAEQITSISWELALAATQITSLSPWQCQRCRRSRCRTTWNRRWLRGWDSRTRHSRAVALRCTMRMAQWSERKSRSHQERRVCSIRMSIQSKLKVRKKKPRALNLSADKYKRSIPIQTRS